MKKLIVFIGLAFFLASHAQLPIIPIPASGHIIPYALQVGYNVTTVIKFPAPVIDGDRGFKDIMVEKEKDISTLIKVKAVRKNFEPTNLHVYTTDGRVYEFTVTYADYPTSLTFDLTLVDDSAGSNSLLVGNGIPNVTAIKELATQLKFERPFIAKASASDQTHLRLRTIHTKDHLMLFGFSLSNQSGLLYDIDFIRFYIRDRQTKKRTTVQEMEVTPLFQDYPASVTGYGRTRFIVAVPLFTIPDRKEFFIEVYEKNGGRKISLKIKNKHLLRAKPL